MTESKRKLAWKSRHDEPTCHLWIPRRQSGYRYPSAFLGWDTKGRDRLPMPTAGRRPETGNTGQKSLQGEDTAA